MKVFLFLLLSLSIQAESTLPLIEAAQNTEKLLHVSAASWTAIHGKENDKHFEIDVYKTSEWTRLNMYFVFEDEKRLLSTTFIGKKFWHLHEDNFYGRFRPYEVPYKMPTSYLYLMKSRVQFADSKNISALGNLTGKENGTYRFVVPLSKEELNSIKTQIDRIRNELLPNASSREESAFYLRQAESLMTYAKEGKINSADEKSGIITRLQSPDGTVLIKNFKLETITDWDYVTPPPGFNDFAEKPDKDKIVFLSHNGTWQPGMNNFQTDGRIFNLTLNKMVRIPFQGAVCVPQYFDYSTNTVYITGIPFGSNEVRPYAINLENGENKLLGGGYLNLGHTNHLTLSSKKNTFAVIYTPQPAEPLNNQLVIIDEESKKIEKYPLNQLCSKLSWLPDSKTLFLQTYNPNEKSHDIMSFEPEKGFTKILSGIDFLILKDQQKLLFLDSVDQLWKTANFNGSNIVTVGDGLHKLQFPAYGLSSKEILMIKEDEKNMPIPVIYDFSSKSYLKLNTPPGLWLTPVWR